jgi:sialate O-acetylesterase
LPAKPENPNQPTVLFNGMLQPIIPFAIRGAIWYQGESNASRAFQYQTLFPLMISAWREKWQQGDFPFFFVQLANYMKRNEIPVEDAWAELREAQSMALKLPNTGMAVTIDIGDGNDIHPANKQDVGKRLAGLARNKVYGENYSYFSPLFKTMKIENDKITIEFENVYEGLKTSDNAEIKGFAIAGEDKKFVWAKAEIKENRVEIRSPKVKNPVAVRYAWSSNPECNLVNSIGLPVSPFRTDTWKGVTQK